MINNNFNNYINEINKSDCEKSLKSSLSAPIPLNLTIDSLKRSQQLILLNIQIEKYLPNLKKLYQMKI